MQGLLRFSVLLALIGSSSCSGLMYGSLPTPLPDDYLPTAIALTLAAGQASATALAGTQAAGEQTPAPPGQTASPTAPVPSPEPVDSSTPADPPELTSLAMALPVTLTPTHRSAPTRTATPTPKRPVADIQIFRPGEASKVTSPLRVSGYLRPGADGKVRIELMGEDGRLLVRLVKEFFALPGARVNISEDLEFQIAGAAEMGRVVISVDDEAGRTAALNSVNLILLSLGEADINPSSALDQAIILREPAARSLIQGGMVRVSGEARLGTDLPLRTELITADGKVVGQRLASISTPDADGYRTFAVEVPYRVAELTPVRLLVFEAGERISPIAHLSSVDIVLSP